MMAGFIINVTRVTLRRPRPRITDLNMKTVVFNNSDIDINGYSSALKLKNILRNYILHSINHGYKLVFKH